MHNMIINPKHIVFGPIKPGSHAISPEVQVAMICASHLINLKTDHCHALPIETLHNIVLGQQIHSGAMLVESHWCWMYIIFWYGFMLIGWQDGGYRNVHGSEPHSHCISLQLLRSNKHGCINSSKDLEYQRVARTSRRLGNTCTKWSFRKLIWSGSVYKPLMISDPKWIVYMGIMTDRSWFWFLELNKKKTVSRKVMNEIVTSKKQWHM